MPRKIVQLTPLKIHDYAGVYLFAVCSDGSAWRAVQGDDGSIAGEWMRIPPIDEDIPPDSGPDL
ncbi:hypothetical protein H0A64_00250 [Alcaligenaceae bacterium]|nr:hypothetical protein [Alcaligenaceae bacterium]